MQRIDGGGDIKQSMFATFHQHMAFLSLDTGTLVSEEFRVKNRLFHLSPRYGRIGSALFVVVVSSTSLS